MGERKRPSPEKKREWRRAGRARAIERYVVLHGFPLCECGCGERVRFDETGKPNRYVNYHSPDGRWAANQERQIDGVPIDAFRAALHKLRVQKGWGVREMARMGGIQDGQMNDLLYSKRKKMVSKEWARNFLARLSGLPAPPTPWMQRMAKQNAVVDKSLAREDWHTEVAP